MAQRDVTLVLVLSGSLGIQLLNRLTGVESVKHIARLQNPKKACQIIFICFMDPVGDLIEQRSTTSSCGF